MAWFPMTQGASVSAGTLIQDEGYTPSRHASLHDGNLVTYMRLKNIVPPSSEPGFGRR